METDTLQTENTTLRHMVAVIVQQIKEKVKADHPSFIESFDEDFMEVVAVDSLVEYITTRLPSWNDDAQLIADDAIETLHEQIEYLDT